MQLTVDAVIRNAKNPFHPYDQQCSVYCVPGFHWNLKYTGKLKGLSNKR